MLNKNRATGIPLAGVLQFTTRGTDMVVVHLVITIELPALVQTLSLDNGLLEYRGLVRFISPTPTGDVKVLVVAQILGLLLDGQANGLDVRLGPYNAFHLNDGNVVMNLSVNVVGVNSNVFDLIVLVLLADNFGPTQNSTVPLSLQIVFPHTNSNDIWLLDNAMGRGKDVILGYKASGATEWSWIVDVVLEECHPGETTLSGWPTT